MWGLRCSEVHLACRARGSPRRSCGACARRGLSCRDSPLGSCGEGCAFTGPECWGPLPATVLNAYVWFRPAALRLVGFSGFVYLFFVFSAFSFQSKRKEDAFFSRKLMGDSMCFLAFFWSRIVCARQRKDPEPSEAVSVFLAGNKVN